MAVFHLESSTEPSRADNETSPRQGAESAPAMLPNAPSPAPASPVVGAEPVALPNAEPTATSNARSPRRTLFAVSLQLSRFFGTLCALTRAGFERDRKTVLLSALLIADGILFGARDRSRDKHLRPLYDQQQRSDSLHKPRPARSRALSRPKSQSSRKGKAA